jgi:putative tryptophan/tyrosine transport system substrate-binding protein
MRRIAVLAGTAADDPEQQARIAAFVQGLSQLGWNDGRNARIDIRWATTDADEIRRHAVELVALSPDVILAATGTATTSPLLQATRTLPIVFVVVIDPVGAGFVESLARAAMQLGSRFTNTAWAENGWSWSKRSRPM